MLLNNFIGTIDNPIGVFDSYGNLCDPANGPLTLVSNLIQLVVLFAGFFALINLITAGFKYIWSAGDPQILEQAQKQMYMSLIGLCIIVMGYVIAAIIGYLFFGDAGFIFKPMLFGPGADSCI